MEDVEERRAEIQAAHAETARAPVVEFVRPHSYENARLVSRGGLFTRAPLGESSARAHLPGRPDSRSF